MAINYSATLYPRNDTTVDTGTGIDVRLLGSTAGSADTTQTVTWTHTQDSTERTFDPATAAAVNTNNAGTTLFKMGWATQLTQDMTPGDDTNCDAMLLSGTLNVAMSVSLTRAGGTNPTAGTQTCTYRASLWRYNPSTDTGTSIASGSTTLNWTWVGAGLTPSEGNPRTATVPITVASPVTFSAGEVLLLQLGANSGVMPNPSLSGTTTYTKVLNLGSITRIDFASGQGIRQICALTSNNIGQGAATRSAYPLVLAGRSVTGTGTIAYSKATIASMAFSLSGLGTPYYSKFTGSYRNFSLQGVGTVPTSGANASTIAVPIDELPANSTYIFPVLD